MITFKTLIKLCKELIEGKKELKEELESTKHELFYTKAHNRFLSEALVELQNEKKEKTLRSV